MAESGTQTLVLSTKIHTLGDSLSKIRDYIVEMSNQAGLDKTSMYRLRLAIDEIATNIIDHGYKEAGLDGDLVLTSTIDDNGLTITLDDTGVAFDPHQLAPPDLGDPLDTRPIGGLGVYLAIQNVDKYIYERVDGHNINSFTMKSKA